MNKKTRSNVFLDNNHFFEFFSNTKIQLILIAILGLIPRVYFFPSDIHITLDGLLYFWYAYDISYTNLIPTGYSFPNNFWPLILSQIFSVANSEYFLELMSIQRVTTIIISVLTIIPLYFFLRKFFEKKYALIGIILFIIEPRIIENSLNGLPESLFIFLGISSLALFLSSSIRNSYFAFILAAFLAMTRYEGLLLLIPLSIIFLVKFKKDKKFLHIFGLLTLFVLILLPMANLRTDTMGNDGLSSHLLGAANVTIQNDPNKINFSAGIINFMQLVALGTLPFFFILIPYGIFCILKRNTKNYLIIIFSLVFLIPTFYAGLRDISEIKYLFILVPIFSLFSLFIIERIDKKIKIRNLFLYIVILICFISSIFFLYSNIDNDYQRENMSFAYEIGKHTSIINDYHPESVYLETIGFSDYNDISGKRILIGQKIEVLFAEEFSTLEKFLEYGEEKNLEYLVADNNTNRPEFLFDVYDNEEKYPYLEKVFDSEESGYKKFKVKLFKINYESLDKTMNS